MDAYDCDHDFECDYCPGCGAYLGQTCVHCGMWYDGGDPVCRFIQDCICEVYVWPKVSIKELVSDYYGTKFQFGYPQHLSLDVIAQIKQAAEWEIRHLLRHKEKKFVDGPAQFVYLDGADKIRHHSLAPGEIFIGVFLAYDIGIYD